MMTSRNTWIRTKTDLSQKQITIGLQDTQVSLTVTHPDMNLL